MVEPPMGVSGRGCAFYPDATPCRDVPQVPCDPPGRSSGHERRSLLAGDLETTDTAASMRLSRSMAVLVLAVLLAAAPGLVLAQSSPTADHPAALLPDARLPLQGTPWRLEGYVDRGTERAPGPEVAAWMILEVDDIQASGGCTLFGGRFADVGAAIRFQLRGVKDKDCAEQTSLVQRAMVKGLREAASYAVVPSGETAGDQLVLLDDAGDTLLRFGLDDIEALDVADWRLLSYTLDGETVPAAPEQAAVLSFRPERGNRARRTSSGSVTGSTGCNGLVTQFFRSADVLSFSPIERTEAPCSPALAAQEAAMLSVLEATSSELSLPAEGMLLTSSDTGASLAFASQRPLEGSTWLIAPTSLGAEAGAALTLRLSEGIAAGEGPCGPYQASYVTDGYFITFHDPVGSGASSCSAAKSERRLLAALRQSVRLDRDQPQLRLLDAFGRTRLRLTSATAR